VGVPYSVFIYTSDISASFRKDKQKRTKQYPQIPLLIYAFFRVEVAVVSAVPLKCLGTSQELTLNEES